MNILKNQKSKVLKGFTLLEMLIVVTIMGVLVSIGTVSYGDYIVQSKENANQQEMKQIAQSIDMGITFGYVYEVGGDAKVLKGYNELTEELIVELHTNYSGINLNTDKITYRDNTIYYELRGYISSYNLNTQTFTFDANLPA